MVQQRQDPLLKPLISLEGNVLPNPQLKLFVGQPHQDLGSILGRLGNSKEAYLLREYASAVYRLPLAEKTLLLSKSLSKLEKERLINECASLKSTMQQSDSRLSQDHPGEWSMVRVPLRNLAQLDAAKKGIVDYKLTELSVSINKLLGIPQSAFKLASVAPQLNCIPSEMLENKVWLEAAVAKALRRMEQYSQKFLKTKNSLKSPLQPKDIIRVCQEENFPIELFLALVGVESGGGLLGRAVGTKNPLNFGNDDHGHSKTFATWEDGIRGCIQGMRNSGFRGQFSTLEDVLLRKKLIGYRGDYCPSKGTGYATKELPGLIDQIVKIMKSVPNPLDKRMI